MGAKPCHDYLKNFLMHFGMKDTISFLLSCSCCCCCCCCCCCGRRRRRRRRHRCCCCCCRCRCCCCCCCCCRGRRHRGCCRRLLAFLASSLRFHHYSHFMLCHESKSNASQPKCSFINGQFRRLGGPLRAISVGYQFRNDKIILICREVPILEVLEWTAYLGPLLRY